MFPERTVLASLFVLFVILTSSSSRKATRAELLYHVIFALRSLLLSVAVKLHVRLSVVYAMSGFMSTFMLNCGVVVSIVIVLVSVWSTLPARSCA